MSLATVPAFIHRLCLSDDAGVPGRSGTAALLRLVSAGKAQCRAQKYFWEKMRGLFFHYLLPDWETLYKTIAFGIKPTVPLFNDSS